LDSNLFLKPAGISDESAEFTNEWRTGENLNKISD